MCTASHTHGRPGGQVQPPVTATEPVLHDAVLARVVREHRDPATGRRQVDGTVDGGGQDLQLAVHLDADGLERALGRMAAATTGRRRNGLPDDAGQLGRRLDRARRDDGGGDADGEALVAVLLEHPHQFELAVAVHDIGGRPLLGRVHPHVDGTVVAIGEPALTLVELRRGNAEIEEDTGDWFRLEIGHDGVEVVEPSVPEGDTVTERGKGLRRCRQCRRVPIDPDQVQVGPGFQQQPSMSPAADRRIHQHTRGHGPEDLDDLLGHHRHVVELGHERAFYIRLLRSPRTRRHVEFAHLQSPGRRVPPGFLPD